MIDLGFLDPAAGRPAARSPLHDAWSAVAGVRTAERGGWTMPVAFGDPAEELAACRDAVALADRSHLTKLELQCGPDDAAAFAAAVEAATGAPPESGRAAAAAGAWWCPLTPTRLLVVAEPGAAPADPPGTATNVTAGFAALSLVGPRARDVLARVSALDLRAAREGALLPGSVAKVPGIVLCERDDALLVLAGSAHAQYLWDTLVDAGEPLGLVRAGLEAVDRVLGEVTHA